MKNITLCPNSVLLRPIDASEGENTHEDVSKRAVEFLFAPVTFHPELKFGDLFGLFTVCPDLLAVYRRFYAAEFCSHAAKGLLISEEMNSMEHIEVSRTWKFNSKTKVFTELSMLRISVASRYQINQKDEQIENYSPDPDGFIRFSLDGADIRYLLDLPLILDNKLKIYEENNHSTQCGKCISTATYTDLSLGELLHTVLWDLSWFGGPTDTQEFFEKIKNMDIVRDDWNYTDAENLIEEECGENMRHACTVLLESIGNCKPIDFLTILRQIPDDENVHAWLKHHIDENICLKFDYRHLGAREFREIFYGVRINS